jgi:biopolymer transport protein ExbD
MVVAPLATVSIKLDLPPAVPNNDPNPKEPVYISIQEGGQLFIASKEVTIENLPAEVCAALQPTPNCRDERLFVRAQPEVKYNQFMEVMNSMQTNGFLKVGLLNEDIE